MIETVGACGGALAALGLGWLSGGLLRDGVTGRLGGAA
jgi:hypothetical protein